MKLALFGSPVKTSLSPRIHGMFAAQFGLDIEYQCIEIQAEGFPGRLEEFRLAGGIGCNVTLPLKRDAWQLAKNSSPQASQAQAANTLLWQSSGDWFAHNTDGIGVVADLTGNHGVSLAGLRILILGAGGAAAGILGNLMASEPREIVLVNRKLERSADLVNRFSSEGNIHHTSWQELAGQGSFDLVINATSLGHQGKAPALTPELFAAGSLCYDLNYFKASQPLKERCKQLHQPYIDGLGMLVEQAAASFCFWTNKQPDSRAVIKACNENI